MDARLALALIPVKSADELWFWGSSLASPQGVLGVIWTKAMSKLSCEILTPPRGALEPGRIVMGDFRNTHTHPECRSVRDLN